MSEVTVAILLVILRYAQVQNHDLIALARVLERATVGHFDANRFASAVDSRWAVSGLSPDLVSSLAIHVFKG